MNVENHHANGPAGLAARSDGLSLSVTDDVPYSAMLDFVVCIVGASLALIWTCLRLFARYHSRTKLQFNDYALLFAMAWGLALAINSCVTVTYGVVGQHMEDIIALAPQNIEPALKTVLIGQFTWALSNTGVKLSIIHFYVKLFGINRTFRWVSYGLMGTVAAYCAMVILMAFLLCQPFAFNWDQTIPGGKCGNQPAAFLSSAILNLILDIAVLLLPLPPLWDLHMPQSKKLAIMVMLSVGVGICGVSVWRTYLIGTSVITDIFFNIGYLSTATNLEPLLGICVACVPVCRPLLSIFGHKALRAGTSVMGGSGKESSMNHTSQRMGGRSATESSTENLYPSTNRSDFIRIEDQYPLSNMKTKTVCEPDEHTRSPSDAINVTETWQVTTSDRR